MSTNSWLKVILALWVVGSYNAQVGAVFLNAAAEPLGIAWTYVENVEPGGRRGFEATSQVPQGIGGIADTLLYAEDAGF